MKINMKKYIDFFKKAKNIKEWGNLFRQYKEVCNYIIFGVVTTIVSFATYGLFRYFVPLSAASGLHNFLTQHLGGKLAFFNMTLEEVHVQMANTVSWVFSVTTAFITNRKWVFDGDVKSAGQLFLQGVRFYASRIFTLIVDNLIVWGGVRILEIENIALEMVVKIFANTIVLILNFILSKIFVFKTKGDKTGDTYDKSYNS